MARTGNDIATNPSSNAIRVPEPSGSCPSITPVVQEASWVVGPKPLRKWAGRPCARRPLR
jgi:hypothetical protein